MHRVWENTNKNLNKNLEKIQRTELKQVYKTTEVYRQLNMTCLEFRHTSYFDWATGL